METIGTVIKGIDIFVKDKHPDGYEKWKNLLSKESLELINNASPSKWYPVKEGVIDPTNHLCKLFYKDAKTGAWESGRYSAEVALSGVYKVFVLISTPAFLMKRATRLINTFYNPTKMEVFSSTNKSMILHMSEMPLKNELVEYRIGGWMEKALEICGCKALKVKMPNSIAKGDPVTTYDISWE